MHVCVRVCAVDVTVISDQYSPLAADLRSSSLSAQPSGQRRNAHQHTYKLSYSATHTHTHTQIHPSTKISPKHIHARHDKSATHTEVHSHIHTIHKNPSAHTSCVRYCPYTLHIIIYTNHSIYIICWFTHTE